MRTLLTMPGRPSLTMLVDREREAMDEICASLVDGVRNARHLEDLEQQAQDHCDRLMAAFRNRRPA